VGTIIAERYHVEELLGAGAMGQVYRAKHVHMQKQVAIKVLHQETHENAEIVSRFEREAIAAGRINHPNVAGATDFGRLPDGAFYLVLEYVQGKSLGALLAETGALPLPRALDIANQIFSALAAAHRADIVHRDLKPDNIMLVAPEEPLTGPGTTASDSGRELVKVLDFGLAKVQKSDTSDTQLTQAGAIYGTPQYMAPEQASGAEVDRRADLYAAGVVLYEMLAGKPPFQADQIMPLLLMHMTEPPPPLPDSIPKPVRKIVSRLLEKQPDARYASADEVLSALAELSLTTSDPWARTTIEFPSLPRSRESFMERGRSSLQSLGAVLARPVEVRGKRVPLGVPIAAGALVLLLGVSLLGGNKEEPGAKPVAAAEEKARPAPPPPSPAPAKRKEIAPELQKVLEAAKQGSDPALYALELRSDDERTDEEWLALTQAYLMRKNVERALFAYGRALDENSRHSSDMTILGPLRYLADDEKYSDAILEFVAGRLRDVAPDFLFDVWSKTSAKTKATERAKELLDTKAVIEHQSEALELALTLRDKPSCEERVELLPRVILRADERSLIRLREMKKDTACAKLAGKTLDEAITQASLRKSPRFPLLKRWRWKTGEGPPPSEKSSSEPKKKEKKFILF